MTTHLLDLTDGTAPNTIHLATDYTKLMAYAPASPKLSTVDLTPVGVRDGGERTSTTRRNVTESARVRFVPTTTAKTNVCLNPSAETTGNYVAAEFPTLTRSTTYALFGSYSYRLETTLNEEGICMTVPALANAAHYVSFYVRGTLPPAIEVNVGSNYVPAIIGTSGSWTRYGAAISAADASGLVFVFIRQDGDAGAGDWYIDGIQVELGTAATAYIDGDQGPLCYWTGTPHGSASTQLTTIEGVRAIVRSIERLFVQAEHYQQFGLGTPVYVHFLPGNSGDTYRSEILSGQITLDEETLGLRNWSINQGEALVTWTRRYYWEAATEVELALTNSSATDTTGGVTVFNHDDATANHDAYVEIAAKATSAYIVGGSVPGPCRLVLNNNYGDALNWPLHLYVGHVICWGSVVPPVYWEAESGTGGATSDDATCSGTGGAGGIGQKVTLTLTTAEAEELYWNFSAANSEAMAGAYYRALARFAAMPTALTQVRLQVLSGSQMLWTGPLITLSSTLALQDLDVLQIPPWMAKDLTLGAIKLALRGLLAGGGSLILDFMLFLPLDSYRHINTVVGYVQTNRAVDDGPRGIVYIDSGEATAVMGGVITTGGPIMLWPGQLQRIYILHDARNGAGTETAPIERTLSVRVFYRPRRLSF